MARTPTYQLTREYNGLPEGALLSIVHPDYVPKETVERWRRPGSYWNEPDPDTWCFTGKGFMKIPRQYIREA